MYSALNNGNSGIKKKLLQQSLKSKIYGVGFPNNYVVN